MTSEQSDWYQRMKLIHERDVEMSFCKGKIEILEWFVQEWLNEIKAQNDSK
jgi:hypothetical protein